MKESTTKDLRKRVELRDEEAAIEAAFEEVDAKLGSLVELIDAAHEARIVELEQEAAALSAQSPRGSR